MKMIVLASIMLASSFAFAWGIGDPPPPSTYGTNTNPRHAPYGWYLNRKRPLNGSFSCEGVELQVVKGWANYDGGRRAVYETVLYKPESPNQVMLEIDEPAYGFAVGHICYRQ